MKILISFVKYGGTLVVNPLVRKKCPKNLLIYYFDFKRVLVSRTSIHFNNKNNNVCLKYHLKYCRYGVRAPTEECTLAIVIISIQSIFGVIIQVFLK